MVRPRSVARCAMRSPSTCRALDVPARRRSPKESRAHPLRSWRPCRAQVWRRLKRAVFSARGGKIPHTTVMQHIVIDARGSDINVWGHDNMRREASEAHHAPTYMLVQIVDSLFSSGCCVTRVPALGGVAASDCSVSGAQPAPGHAVALHTSAVHQLRPHAFAWPKNSAHQPRIMARQ
jgi:hypothetical protein